MHPRYSDMHAEYYCQWHILEAWTLFFSGPQAFHPRVVIAHEHAMCQSAICRHCLFNFSEDQDWSGAHPIQGEMHTSLSEMQVLYACMPHVGAHACHGVLVAAEPQALRLCRVTCSCCIAVQ